MLELLSLSLTSLIIFLGVLFARGPHILKDFFFSWCCLKLRALRHTFIVEPVWFESQTDRLFTNQKNKNKNKNKGLTQDIRSLLYFDFEMLCAGCFSLILSRQRERTQKIVKPCIVKIS